MLTHQLHTEADTLAFGRYVAAQTRAGETIALSGPLGSGKTVFARGFIRQRIGYDIDVSSPTFNIVQVYDQTTPAIWHFDFFRLEHPDECAELGLDEALAKGLTIIEWPDKAAGWLPKERLDIFLTGNEKTSLNSATLRPSRNWQARIEYILQQSSK